MSSTSKGRPEAAAESHFVPLALILLLALVVRLAYLATVAATPGFSWPDPDHYFRGAEMLSQGGWHWTFRAVRYEWAGRFNFLPPLYPIFLSLFSVFPNMALAAQIGQVLVGVAAVGLLFDAGRTLHSPRAGLTAAAIYALWFPNVIATWFYQETLYVPLLLLAFALFVRARRSTRPCLFHAIAGAVFGLAALTRSMPLYYIAPLLVVEVARERSWTGLRDASVAALSFLLMITPYSVALSRHVGELTVVENHAGIILLSEDSEATESAGLEQTVASVVRTVLGDPLDFLSRLYESLRSVLHVNGGRLLHSYIVAADRARAVLWKGAALLFSDLAFVATLVLAPLGLAASRRVDASLATALWISVNLGLVAVGGFAGPRLRSPFEPHLILYASIALCGGLASAPRSRRALAAAVALAVLVVPQIPRSLAAWPDYGVQWQARPRGDRTIVRGEAGFNLLPVGDRLSMDVRARPASDSSSRTVVSIVVMGQPRERLVLSPREARRVEYPWIPSTLAFIELEASEELTGKPRELLVTKPPRRTRSATERAD